MKATEIIALPPRPRRERGRATATSVAWGEAAALLTLLVFALGFWLGGRGPAGSDQGGRAPTGLSVERGAGASAGVEAEAGADFVRDRLLDEARAAVAAENWAVAQQRYQDLLELQPQHAEASVALPLLERHLEVDRGGLLVETEPRGAQVRLGELAVEASPARFQEVPVGHYALEISLAGYERVQREVEVKAERLVALEPIVLQPSRGQLKLSSEPSGATFRVEALESVGVAEKGEWTKSGMTPMTLNEVPVGAYEVVLTREGWPDHRERIEVRAKRESSVSHVFAEGGLQVTSDPSGAEVWVRIAREGDPEKLGETPVILSDLPVGEHELELRYLDWRPIRRTVVVNEGVDRTLSFAWKRGLVSFVSDPPGAAIYREGKRVGTVGDFTPFEWEFPEGDYEFTAELPKGELSPVALETAVRADLPRIDASFAFGYGTVSLDSQPPGATVLVDGEVVGTTPFRQAFVKPGTYAYVLQKRNYRDFQVSGEVKAGEGLEVSARLRFDPGPERGRAFTHSLGGKMIWVEPLGGWVGAHEVTQEVYEGVTGGNPSQFRGAERPVDSVSWNDAAQFLVAFNDREKARNTVPRGYRYRLPSDEEWTLLAADARLEDAVTSIGNARAGSAVVGSLAPNRFGLYDTRGNVWEWCEDWYTVQTLQRMQEVKASGNPSWADSGRKVLRGGSWSRAADYDLALGYRLGEMPSESDRRDVGFRIVLMPERDGDEAPSEN